ncbi:hypothetical protein D3C87_2030720 [compost metagenome]
MVRFSAASPGAAVVETSKAINAPLAACLNAVFTVMRTSLYPVCPAFLFPISALPE